MDKILLLALVIVCVTLSFIYLLAILLLSYTHKSALSVSSLEVNDETHHVQGVTDHSHLKLIRPHAHTCTYVQYECTLYSSSLHTRAGLCSGDEKPMSEILD